MSKNVKQARSSDNTKSCRAKRQFRNENEKRRRDLFSQLISNLEDILDINKSSASKDQINRLEKASILRETALYLKSYRQNFKISSNSPSSSFGEQTKDLIDFSWKPQSDLITNNEWIDVAIQSMNCFFLVTKSDPHTGKIVYVSKHIKSLLDYSQNELFNCSLFQFILPGNHDQLRDYLLRDHKVLETCNLSWKRATSDEYEQCTFIGIFRQIKKEKNEKYFVSLVKVNTLDKTLNITNEKSAPIEFITRLNLHGRFAFVDPNVRELLGYNSYEIIGRTFFDFIHPDDLPIMARAYRIWKENGSGQSDPYRFLSKGQQWVFLQTKSQVQINSWTGKPEIYVCTSIVLGNTTLCVQKQLPNLSTCSESTLTSLESTLQTNSERADSSENSQIKSFLTHLTNETYRTNMREKFLERRVHKQCEIRVREEEIKVIDDLLHFIDGFESRHSSNVLPLVSVDSANQKEMNSQPMSLRSPLLSAIEGFSSGLSQGVLRHSQLTDIQSTAASKNETTFDSLSPSLFSPLIPFSNLSHPLTSPLITLPSIQTVNDSVGSSSSHLTTPIELNMLPVEESSTTLTFNRSLPHNLFP